MGLSTSRGYPRLAQLWEGRAPARLKTGDLDRRAGLHRLGGSRSCTTADGAPEDADAMNYVPPALAIDVARRGGIVVEA